MQTSTINNKSMQRSNLASVLWIIYKSGGISRRDVAAQTGLTPSSVTNIVSKLIQDGLVRQTDGDSEAGAGVGRRPIGLEICASRYAVVGVELSADRISAVVTDFAGEPLAQGHVANRASNPPEVAVAKLAELVDGLMEEASVDRRRVLGVGLMSSGPYDPAAGRMYHQANFEGWEDVPIRDLTQGALGLPVCFDRDSVGCALDAQWMGETTGALFAILVNTIGIGGALVIDGKVYYGLENSASEIGCMTVIPDGPLCRCGDRGCLEAVSTADAMLIYIRGRVAQGAPDPFAGIHEPDAKALAEAYRQGKALAVEAVERGAKYLGIAIGNIIKVVSPNTIAIGGGFLTLLPEYYPLILKAARNRKMAMPVFVPFAHGSIQCALGGVRLVVQNFFTTLEQRCFSAAAGDSV